MNGYIEAGLVVWLAGGVVLALWLHRRERNARLVRLFDGLVGMSLAAYEAQAAFVAFQVQIAKVNRVMQATGNQFQELYDKLREAEASS